MTDSSTYPSREAYFAHRYCRLLTKTCAAQEIGHVAFALCVTIAHQEDAKRYSGPVTFFNEQLLPLVAVTKWESLDRARQRAAAAGWLHYEPGNRGQRMPGRYWVTIPKHLEQFDDQPCDESQYPAKGEWTPSQYPAKGEREGERRGEREGEHSTLTLNSMLSDDNHTPQRRKKAKRTRRAAKRFVIPAVQEVAAYCLERNKGIDPEHFVDYYQAREWRFKNGQSMKDWRATIRNWERNNFSGNGHAKEKEPVKYRG